MNPSEADQYRLLDLAGRIEAGEDSGGPTLYKEPDVEALERSAENLRRALQKQAENERLPQDSRENAAAGLVFANEFEELARWIRRTLDMPLASRGDRGKD